MKLWPFLLALVFNFAIADPYPDERYAEIYSRYSFTFVYEQLAPIIDLCLQSNDCRLDGVEESLLTEIRRNLSLERQKNSLPLQFVSSDKNPTLFQQDGAMRVAVTGSEIGSTIFINMEVADALPYYRAISILIHELGHHHRVNSHEALTRLGLKIEMFFLRQIQWAQISGPDRQNQDPDLRSLLIHLGVAQFPFQSDVGHMGSRNILWIYDEAQLVDLGPMVQKMLKCPLRNENEGRLKSYRFFNPRWYKYFPHGKINELRTYVESMNLQLDCVYNENGKAIEESFPRLQVRLHLNFRWARATEFPPGRTRPRGSHLYVFDHLEKIELVD